MIAFRMIAFQVIALIALASLLAAGPSLAQENGKLAARGHAILSEQCSQCHQVEPAGESPNREAPAFRVLMQRYDPEDLEEALGEGLATGHPDMPEFVFEPDDIAAIVSYLGVLRDAR